MKGKLKYNHGSWLVEFNHIKLPDTKTMKNGVSCSFIALNMDNVNVKDLVDGKEIYFEQIITNGEYSARIIRPKQGESTFCTYTVCGSEIREGDILGYGDNYPCVVFYNPFEGRFDAIEFGNKDKGKFRTHDLRCYTNKWKILGNIDTPMVIIKLKGFNKSKFDYVKELKKYFIDGKD